MRTGIINGHKTACLAIASRGFAYVSTFGYLVPTLLFLTLALLSCDVNVGIEGKVINFANGEPIEGVTVTMNSAYGEIIDTTDSNGFFSTEQIFGCGLRKCNESFDIVFEKKGFTGIKADDKSINQLLVGGTYIISMDSLRIELIDICCEEK